MRNPEKLVAVATAILAASAVAADAPPPLSQAEMQQILTTLRAQFAQPDAVGFAALNRTAIDGLLREHPQTLQLLTVPDTAPAPLPPPACESLTPQIACLRPFAFRKEDAMSSKEFLTKLATGETAALILDLRAPAADSDPAAAAAFAELFLPNGTALFTSGTTYKTTGDPVWPRELIVLIDGDTCNTGEVLAAVLKSRAFFIGSATRGRTAAMTDLPLRKTADGTLVLRFASQRVSFPDGDPFGAGVVPNLAAAMKSEMKREVFALQAKEGLARGVFQPARPRTNEAALVARTNPELPDRIARTAGRPGPNVAAAVDRPLQLAVDILVARKALAP